MSKYFYTSKMKTEKGFNSVEEACKAGQDFHKGEYYEVGREGCSMVEVNNHFWPEFIECSSLDHKP